MDSLDKYNPNQTLENMIYQNFMWGLLGIGLGIIVNLILQSVVNTITKKYKNEIKLVFQLAICSIVLAIIHVKINNKFGWTWQNITPGLFFVSYFFGAQFSTFSNIQSINDKLFVYLQ
jgi:hypothetical protein